MLKKRHLILAPHHDDTEFGMGGCIQHFLAAGDDVRVIVAARGNYTRYDGFRVLGSVRVDESRAALDRLGVTDMVFEDWFVENGALEVPYGGLVANIESAIKEYEPTDVYVCLPSFNQDHERLYNATITAFRPARQSSNLFAYEYPGTCWGSPMVAMGKRYFVLTPDQMQTKIDALGMHSSQFIGRLAGVDPDSAQKLAAMRGAEVGAPYAELIYVLKEIIRP